MEDIEMIIAEQQNVFKSILDVCDCDNIKDCLSHIIYVKNKLSDFEVNKENKNNNFILKYCGELYESGHRNWDDENHYKYERKRIIIKNIKEGKNTPYLLSILEYDKMMKIIKKI